MSRLDVYYFSVRFEYCFMTLQDQLRKSLSVQQSSHLQAQKSSSLGLEVIIHIGRENLTSIWKTWSDMKKFDPSGSPILTVYLVYVQAIILMQY